MKRGLAALAACLALAPATATAAERSLLVNGDSLAEGTRPYVPGELPGWKVRQSTKVSRHAAEAADVLRGYGRSLARVIHVSLGTNDDPGQTGAFRTAVDDVMDIAGSGRNRVLASEDERRDNLLVLNWVRMVRRHHEWLARDGVHVSAAGYAARARAVGRLVRRCD